MWGAKVHARATSPRFSERGGFAERGGAKTAEARRPFSCCCFGGSCRATPAGRLLLSQRQAACFRRQCSHALSDAVGFSCVTSHVSAGWRIDLPEVAVSPARGDLVTKPPPLQTTKAAAKEASAWELPARTGGPAAADVPDGTRARPSCRESGHCRNQRRGVAGSRLRAAKKKLSHVAGDLGRPKLRRSAERNVREQPRDGGQRPLAQSR